LTAIHFFYVFEKTAQVTKGIPSEHIQFSGYLVHVLDKLK